MRKLLLILSIGFSFFTLSAQDLGYYLPDSVQYDPSIPKPKDVIYHEVGEWHVTHDRLVNYMQALAKAAPGRIKLETMGYTYEGRPQVLLIITSPENHRQLETIREQHLALSDPEKSASLNTDKMPIVVWVGHSIHGNEPSGANAALVSAYYLAAAQGNAIEDLLKNVVILFDPSFNPDGLQRFSTWVNQHKSKNLVTDPNSREFNEVWPGGRYNHYWFDINRDWLPAVHVESQNRLKWFHKWKPNILTDHHEQESNATFFFQPGVPSRVNPLTPARNQELTTRLAKYHAAFLDRIGSLYFSKENYDDFYYGKGSTYPDINGAIGILFEQGSSRGHAQQTSNGILRFPFTIRNQFVTTLSTLTGANALRKDFLDFQREFYKASLTDAASYTVKGYVFGEADDPGKVNEFITMLRRHEIDVYSLNTDVQSDGNKFQKGKAYIIPAAQKQYRVIRAIFDKTLSYKDSLFYDITAWTMPLAFGIPYAELDGKQFHENLLGDKNTMLNRQPSKVEKSDLAYLLEWNQFYAPAALYELQVQGIITKVASNALEISADHMNRKFDRGTILIPVQSQNITTEKLYSLIQTVANKYNLNFYGLTTGSAVSGSDLGSRKFIPVTKPVIATVTGTGVSALDAGELWHLMDQRFNIPMSQLDVAVFNKVDLGRYNTIILVNGKYPELNKEKLKAWVQAGGNLIVTEDAVTWAAQNGISNVTFKKVLPGVDSNSIADYASKEQIEGAQQMRGAIFKAEADLSNPLAYGYTQPFISLFKGNKVYMEKSRSPFLTPFYYREKPLQSGWVSWQNLEAIKNSAAVVVSGSGSGRIISIADNPNFRAFWLGGSKLMMNSVFFGRIIETGSSAANED